MVGLQDNRLRAARKVRSARIRTARALSKPRRLGSKRLRKAIKTVRRPKIRVAKRIRSARKGFSR